MATPGYCRDLSPSSVSAVHSGVPTDSRKPSFVDGPAEPVDSLSSHGGAAIAVRVKTISRVQIAILDRVLHRQTSSILYRDITKVHILDRVALQTGENDGVARIGIRHRQVADADVTDHREAAVQLSSGADRVAIHGIRRASKTGLILVQNGRSGWGDYDRHINGSADWS